MIKKQNGITLIALVITIIIIIILASITMNMVFGENGLVERAEMAKNMTEEASRKEQEDLANAVAYINDVIYGNGSSSGNTNGVGTNTEEPGTNEIDTNTVEPPPVEVPSAEEGITVGEITWEDGKAQVEINTEEPGYTIEYKVNDGEWKPLEEADEGNSGTEGIIPGLEDGDEVHIRLTDGEQAGEESIIKIKDEIAPKVDVSLVEITTNSIEVKATAKDNESGMAESLTYTYYIKLSSEEDYGEAVESNSTGEYIFAGLNQGESYDVKVEVVGDKAGNAGAGELKNQTTGSIPGGSEGVEQGAIAFGAPSWNAGKANVVISTNTTYSIEYQVNGTEEENWEAIENNGIVEGLSHGDVINARLTDGSNHGDYASYTVADGIVPANAKIELNPTSAMVGDTITALVNQIDNESGVNATASKWIFSTTAGEIGTEDSSYTGTVAGTYGTFTKSEEEIQIKAVGEGEYYGVKIDFGHESVEMI